MLRKLKRKIHFSDVPQNISVEGNPILRETLIIMHISMRLENYQVSAFIVADGQLTQTLESGGNRHGKTLYLVCKFSANVFPSYTRNPDIDRHLAFFS